MCILYSEDFMEPVLFEYVPFIHRSGKREDFDLKLFALPSCGFCSRAKKWLNAKGFFYKMIYMDTLESTLKKQVKTDFQNAFGFPLTYPTLVIDGKDTLVGFIEIDWKQTLIADK